MELTILRHAPARENLLRQYIGCSDPPLCAEGVAMAMGRPKRREVPLVYTSCLQRAVQTAEILYPGARLEQVSGFDEMNFGDFERRTWEELRHDPAYNAWLASDCEAPCPGGESKAQFIRRCSRAFVRLMDEADRAGETSLYIVAHAGTIMAVLSEYALPARDYFDWTSGFCGGYHLRVQRGEGIDGPPVLHLLETIVGG